jgi:hypothetical protein
MPLFGGAPKKKKIRGKKGLKDAFDIQLSSGPRDRAAEAKEAAKDKAIAILAREKKKEAARQQAIDEAEEIKEKARQREADRKEAARKLREKDARAARSREPEYRTACNCRKPTLRNGKCTRCKKVPAGRRRGLFG